MLDDTFKRFLRGWAFWATILGALIGVLLVVAPLPGVGLWDGLLFRTILGAIIGFMVVGVPYLLFMARAQKNLEMSQEELDKDEFVLVKGPANHFKTGRALRFWEGTGGKLFLTNRRLVFKAHAGQPWVYELALRLESVRCAEPFKLLGFIRGGLRVETEEGAQLFSVGVFGPAKELASAIRALCEARDGMRV